MKVFIKNIQNGWLVRYQVFDDDDRLRGEKEKAFTYVLDDEKKKEEAWRRLEWFIARKLLTDWVLHEKMYPLTYDEEKEEWVGNEEFERRKHETEELNDYFYDQDLVFHLMGLDKEKITTLTREQWELKCTELTFKRLIYHFGENDSMDYEKYVEIKNAAIKEFTKKCGLQPKEN